MNQKEKFEFVKSAYLEYDVCMDEILNDCSADGLTIGEAFELYISAMNWSDGDKFYRTSGFSGETKELEYLNE